MRIIWSIKKERGFFRPKLEYSVILEDWESSLGIPVVYIQSPMPSPKERWDLDRLTIECDDHSEPISIDSRGAETTLPFRQSGEYPEIEESMTMLRDKIEAAIIKAHDALALKITGSLEMTPATKKHVAAYAAAWKMTQAGKEY